MSEVFEVEETPAELTETQKRIAAETAAMLMTIPWEQMERWLTARGVPNVTNFGDVYGHLQYLAGAEICSKVGLPHDIHEAEKNRKRELAQKLIELAEELLDE